MPMSHALVRPRRVAAQLTNAAIDASVRALEASMAALVLASTTRLGGVKKTN